MSGVLRGVILECLYSVEIMGEIGLATDEHFGCSAAGLHSRLMERLVKQVGEEGRQAYLGEVGDVLHNLLFGQGKLGSD